MPTLAQSISQRPDARRTTAAVAAFTAERHVNYPIVLGSPTVADAYGGVRFLPQSVFLGRNGRIIKRTYGIRQKADFENDIRQSLVLP